MEQLNQSNEEHYEGLSEKEKARLDSFQEDLNRASPQFLTLLRNLIENWRDHLDSAYVDLSGGGDGLEPLLHVAIAQEGFKGMINEAQYGQPVPDESVSQAVH